MPIKFGIDPVLLSLVIDSDGLTGSVSVKTKKEWLQLWENRTYTGNNAGSRECTGESGQDSLDLLSFVRSMR
jgi:hypothetical protein